MLRQPNKIETIRQYIAENRDNPAEINRTNQFGETALIKAAANGYTAVVEALLAAGANVNAATRFGDTALILAASNGYIAVVNLLLAIPNIDINAQNCFQLTAAGEAEKKIYERPYSAHIYRTIYDLITADIRSRATEKAITKNAIIAILTYWHGEHKFISAIRLLNKYWRDDVAEQIAGPYACKAHFIFANTGIYHTKKVAMEAFRVYERTIHSASTLPAVFYALSERSLLKSTLFKEPGFTGGDNIYKNGRVYGPKEMHAWDINASWVFAQLHKRRHIQVMTSYPVGDNTHRRGGDYSALTKEIALAFRAGYDIVNVEFRQDGRRIVHLGPAHLIHSIILSLSLRDLILTDEDCQFAIRHMKNMVDNVYKTNQLNAPITLFSNSAPNQQRCVPAPPLSFSP